METDERSVSKAATRFAVGDMLTRLDDGTSWVIDSAKLDDRCGDGVGFYVVERTPGRRLLYVGAWSVATVFQKAERG